MMIVKIGLFFLNLFYFFAKLAPVENKVVFISRQSDKPNPDFLMLTKQLKQDNPQLKTVMLCKTLGHGLKAKLSYMGHMFVQMHQLATSRVVVLDSYCILASCLHHRPDLKIIQMWHALGCSKKFGCSILDQPGGSSSKLAHTMHMHEQYDYVFTSAKICQPYFAQALNTAVDKVLVQPLPRVDRLCDEKIRHQKAEEIYTKYPQLKNKESVLYAPTFRVDETQLAENIDKLIKLFDYEHYELIISLHPLSKINITDTRVIRDSAYSSMEWASAVSEVITVYSAVVYEIALLEKPLLFYVFDRQSYGSERDFYLDFDSEMPGPLCDTAEKLLAALDNHSASARRVKEFADKYIDPTSRHDNTVKIAALISQLANHKINIERL